MGEVPTRHRGESGAGSLSAVLGVAIVMALVGLAANVTLGLWSRSTVDSVAYDAARQVATAPAGSDPRTEAAEATARARSVLGALGRQVELRFEGRPDGEFVVLHVRAPGVALLPRIVDGGPTVGALDRRIVMAREVRP